MQAATAQFIKNHYPENIQITGTQDPVTNKWKVSVFLLDKKAIVKLLLNSPAAFKTRYLAEEHAKIVCQSILSDSNL